MVFKSVNPKNGKLMKSFELLSNTKMHEKLDNSFKMYKYMRNQGEQGIVERFTKFQNIKEQMNNKKQTLAELITTEMGKPIKESIAEVEKSISMIDYYAQNA